MLVKTNFLTRECAQNAATVAELRKEYDAQNGEIARLRLTKENAAIRLLERQKKEKIAEELHRNEKIGFLLEHNWRVVAMNYCINIFVELLHKYGGKQYGTKTAEKIKNEFLTLSGGFGFALNTTSVHFYKSKPYYSGIDTATLLYNGTQKPRFLYNNKINGDLTAGDIGFYESEYINDIGAKLAQIESKADELRKAREALEAARSAYVREWVQGFDDVNRI